MDILGRTRPPLNLVISNVPGPREPLYCAGAQLQANFPVSVVIDGVGLNMTVMSYRDHVDFGIITDRDQVDDAWPLMDGTAAALDELETAVCGKRARPAKRPPPVCAHTRLGDLADAAVVVAGEAAAPAAISGPSRTNTSASVVSLAAGTWTSRTIGGGRRLRGGGALSVAGMAAAVPGATARAATAQASVMRRCTNMRTSWSAPLQRG